MPAVKLTKNELKKQKDALKRFQRYLPTLMLKKQQLQMVIQKVEQQIRQLEQEQQEIIKRIEQWIAVFGENAVLPKIRSLQELIIVKRVEREMGNIAGVSIPVFREIEFEHIEYDLLRTPFWVDRAIETLKELGRLDAEISTLEKQRNLLQKELRTTSQRVNLFEKVKIPEAKSNIRKIQIYLGDQQTAAVVRGKISKNKIVKVS